ncbi:MAG TPA: HIT family protein [Halothiobacillaceae bacterium]|nr:HIT family protein [Halothiobacillaceae bacterium]
MNNNVELPPRLAEDSHFCLNLDLCQLRLSDDARFIWFILIPRVSAVEVTKLSADEYMQLMREVRQVATAVEQVFGPDKINIASLGNQVPQLHLHVIARYKDDEAWPGPVWGYGQPVGYKKDEIPRICDPVVRLLTS